MLAEILREQSLADRAGPRPVPVRQAARYESLEPHQVRDEEQNRGAHGRRAVRGRLPEAGSRGASHRRRGVQRRLDRQRQGDDGRGWSGRGAQHRPRVHHQAGRDGGGVQRHVARADQKV